MGSLSLPQGIFLIQESNRGLLHCRQILYLFSYRGSLFPVMGIQNKAVINAVSCLHRNVPGENFKGLLSHSNVQRRELAHVCGLRRHRPASSTSGCASGEGCTSRCRRYERRGFGPWVGKVPWRRQWQPSPVSMPGEPHGQSSLVDPSP